MGPVARGLEVLVSLDQEDSINNFELRVLSGELIQHSKLRIQNSQRMSVKF
jgi:hypothetical protein